MVDSNEEDLNMPNMSRQKIVFVGDVSVGKTSIINRFVDNKFREGYEPSIGVDFSSKTLRTKGKSLKLQIWDSAGQERYKSLIPTYIRGSSIIFIIYDISMTTWINFVKNYENSLIVLCGNKKDLERQVEFEEAEKLANKEGLLFFEISAKTNENLNLAFFSAVAELPVFTLTGRESIGYKQQIIKELRECNESVLETTRHNIEVPGLNVRGTDPKKKAKDNCKC